MRVRVDARASASRARDARWFSARARRRASSRAPRRATARDGDDGVPELFRYDAHRSLDLDDRARRDPAALAALARDDTAVAFACDASGARALCEENGW